MPNKSSLLRLRQSLRHARIALPLALWSAPHLHAGDLTAVLERMEPGSVIKDLLIPRYDENKKASLVLRANRVVVESLQTMTAENLSLHLISSKNIGSLNGSLFSIEQCQYDLTTNLLRSDSAVDVVSEGFLLHSNGLVTKIEQNQLFFTAFLLPPVHGFINPSSNEKTAMTRSQQSLLLASILSSQALAQGTAPQPPAAEDAFYALTPRSQEVDAQLQQFAKANGVKIEAVTLPNQPPPVLKPVDPVVAMPKFAPAADALGFACKGGVFYDSKSASLTLLKDVTVRNPDYAMTVAGEVKVFFEPEPEKKSPTAEEKKKIEEKKEGAATEEKPLTPEEKKNKDDKDSNSLGKVKQLVGTGGVAFEATDKDGVKNFASGDSVIYEMATEEIFLKGNKLVFQQGVQSRFESASPNAWLRYNKRTKSFTMSDGWNARLTLPN